MTASRPSLLILLALGAGCATEEPVKEERRAAASRPRPSRADEGARIAQVGQYIIYPVQWLRAEEVAETLYPILQTRYGSAVRIIPHIPTNQLIIYIPTRRETEESLRGGGGVVTQPGVGVPPAGAPRTPAPIPASTRAPTGTRTRGSTGTSTRTSGF